MAKRYKETNVEIKEPSNKEEMQDKTREEQIEIQKQKRKQKKEEEKRKEEEQKKNEKEEKINKKKKEKTKQKEQKKNEKQQKESQKRLEKHKKQNEKNRQKEREKRIEKMKKQQKADDFEYESNEAIRMTLKNNKNKKREEQISKKQREINRKRKKRNKILKITMLLAIIIGGSIFALTSPIFNITNIEVLGSKQLSENTIESLSGLQKDQNIFKFLKINVETSIKGNPFIENVEIKRILPNTIQIKIEERTKKYAIKYLNSYAIINNQGYILEINENSEELPIIVGIKTSEEEITPGNRLNNTDLEKLEVVIKIMGILKDSELEGQVSSIDITDGNEYSIYMESEQKKIYLGDKTNLNYKIIYVQAIMEKTKGVAGEIFVNGDLNEKFKPYFREKIS